MDQKNPKTSYLNYIVLLAFTSFCNTIQNILYHFPEVTLYPSWPCIDSVSCHPIPAQIPTSASVLYIWIFIFYIYWSAFDSLGECLLFCILFLFFCIFFYLVCFELTWNPVHAARASDTSDPRLMRLILRPCPCCLKPWSLRDTRVHTHSFLHYFNKIASQVKSSGCVCEDSNSRSDWKNKCSPQEELWWWLRRWDRPSEYMWVCSAFYP